MVYGLLIIETNICNMTRLAIKSISYLVLEKKNLRPVPLSSPPNCLRCQSNREGSKWSNREGSKWLRTCFGPFTAQN